MSPVLPLEARPRVALVAFAFVFLSAPSLAGPAKEREPAKTNLDVLVGLLDEVGRARSSVWDAEHAVRRLRFRADDPDLADAALAVREIARFALPKPYVRKQLIQRARELESGIVSIPPVWTDPPRLRDGWRVLCEARYDLDGDGIEEVVADIGHYLLVYRRHEDEWRLAAEYDRGSCLSVKGVSRIDRTDFDDDGEKELLVEEEWGSAGTGGGFEATALKVFTVKPAAGWKLACILTVRRRHASKHWRGARHFHEWIGEESVEDLDGDGHKDVLVRYVLNTYDPDDFEKLRRSRPVLREDRYMWRDGAFVLDKESMRETAERLAAEALSLQPAEGLELAERILRDFDGLGDMRSCLHHRHESHRPILADARRAWAIHLHALGRLDQAYEGFLRLKDHRMLAEMCEEEFDAPGAAARWCRELAAGGLPDSEEISARAARLETAAKRRHYRPLRPGEIAEVKTEYLRVVEHRSVVSGWYDVHSASWSHDGERIVFCGSKKEERPRWRRNAFVWDGESLRPLGAASCAVFYGNSYSVLVDRREETPEGEYASVWEVIGEDGSTRRIDPGSPYFWADAISVSPDGRFIASARSLGGAEGEGTAVRLSGPDHPGSRILVEHADWDTPYVVVGWRDSGELVMRVCSQVKLYDVDSAKLSDLDPKLLGPGRYDYRFSHDGTHAAWWSSRYLGIPPRADGGGRRILWVARADGSSPKPIETRLLGGGRWRLGAPKWSPDGTRLLVGLRGSEGQCSLSILVLGRRVGKTGE